LHHDVTASILVTILSEDGDNEDQAATEEDDAE
jgi:large subunit ribosomal protein L9